jgi:hypothetical protein
MADNYNVSTTQGQANEAGALDQNNPAMTYVDFANQIAKNSATQQLQDQAVQQAKLMTQQKTAAAGMGVNPELQNFLPVDEAVAELKAAGVDEDTINDFVNSLNGQTVVNRASIDTIIRKKMLSTKMSVAGKNFKTSDDITIPTGMQAADLGLVADPTKPGIGHVPSDGEYQISVDPNSGQPMAYIALGETPPAPGAGKDEAADEKSWQKLDAETNKFIRSSRGNTITQAVQRANRALNELGEGQPLTAQVLSFIQKDLSGIFQGGMPPVSGMDAEDFTTALQKVNQFIGKYTGIQGYLHTDLGNQREYLIGILSRLRDSTVNMLKASISSEASGYQKAIDDDPQRWQQFVDDKMNAVISGLSQNAQTTLEAYKASPAGNLPPAMTPAGTTPATPAPSAGGAPNVDALAAALGLKKKVQ